MKIRIWGARGSIPTPLSNAQLHQRLCEALRYAVRLGLQSEQDVPGIVEQLPWFLKRTVGGDSTCFEVIVNDTNIVLDAGSGIRALGNHLMKVSSGAPIEVHILISHTHWDHIAGFPFFAPAYIPNNRITFYGPQEGLEGRIRRQQDSEFFPVSLDAMNAEINFVHIAKRGSFNIKDVEISSFPLNHPGGCFSYRIQYNGRSIVYATDSEYQDLSQEALQPFIEFFRGADLLIFDAQYTLMESVEKVNWGHSNAFVGIEIAAAAGVKSLVLTHHEPTYSDEMLWDIYQKGWEYLSVYHSDKKMELCLAEEGLEIEV